MHDVLQADLANAAPMIDPNDVPRLSDEECILRLARAVEHESGDLDEVARLIGRLAVTIE